MRPPVQNAAAVLVAGVGVVVVAVVVAACGPLGGEGASCSDAPCEAGLTCVEGTCKKVPPPKPPPPPCAQDADCVLDGSADGRVCNDDGTCSFAACFLDLQCGTRICDQGTCAPNVPCFTDGDCDADQICNNGSCRAACTSDGDCPAVAGFNLATCVDGQCLQRCLTDQTCLTGGICDANVCVDPQCAVDDDCANAGPGQYFCNAGRCEQFTPCDTAADCFDPDFLCNDLGRCEERPACTVDGECGLGLCINTHCRDAVACTAAADCPAGANPNNPVECVAGRCVDGVACRASADCAAADKVCDNGRCVDAALGTAASLVVRTPLGACFAGGAGACAVPAFVGDVVSLYAQGFGTDGAPVRASVVAASDALTNVVVDGDGRVEAQCAAAGDAVAHLTANEDDGAVSVDVTVRCLDAAGAPAGGLGVVVYEGGAGGTGAPVAGAHVFVDDAEVGVTGADGVFAIASFSDGASVGVKTGDGRGFVVLGAQGGRLFVPLVAVIDAGAAAGFRALVNGTGDELGDVGLALAVPQVSSAADASLERMLGDAFPASIEIPVIGAIPVSLPASAIMDATLPVVGSQEVKAEAFDVSSAGPSSLLAFEGRYAQQLLTSVAFGGGDPRATALDFTALAEGMDAKLAAAGDLAALPLVVDEGDVDGDGDTAELVPDYASFDEIAVSPSTPPLERVGIVTSAPPAGSADVRAFAVCGVQLPHALLPLGIAALHGSEEGGTGEQLKLLSPPSSVAGAPRVCTVHAVSADASTQSYVVARAGAFAAVIDAGPLLAPPAGAFTLDDVPAAGRTSIVLPSAAAGADAAAVLVFDGQVTWTVAGAAGGSLVLPAYVDAQVLAGTTVYRLGASPASALSSPIAALDDVAAAVATSP